MVPTKEEIEEYLNALDEWVSTSFHAATSDLPSLNTIANRIWSDLGRFGPPHIQVPSLGIFDVPPPPPPPVQETTWLERSASWIADNKFKAMSVVIGSGLLVGYVVVRLRQSKMHSRKRKSARKAERKDVAVVIGADCLIGLPLVTELENRGFIVIATVSAVESVPQIEQNGHGYVRAMVLDPSDSQAVPTFLRSLQTTLSLKFPTAGAGDPYASPSLHPHIHTVISLLSLRQPPTPTPLEHLALSTTYLAYLQESHITPLNVLQGILPLMRNPVNSHAKRRDKKKIVVCLPVIASRVGVAWNSAQAMSAGATSKGIDVLRRELREAGQAQRLSVVIVDVGFVGDPGASDTNVFNHSTGAASYMSDWSSNLRAAYGPAFLGAIEQQREHPRIPTDVNILVSHLATYADESGQSYADTIFDWYNWERVSLGAGAYTYTIASKLPQGILDALLSLPSLLVQLKNAMIMNNLGPVVDVEVEVEPKPEENLEQSVDSVLAKTGTRTSAAASEADTDNSHVGDREHIGASWINLNSGKGE